jgi:hypothetical protein
MASTYSPDLQTILPWNNSELEQLLKDLVAHGTEAAKVDFKTEIEANSPEKKADLLKDISAMGNTYDDRYHDHGFLIFGVKGKAIIGAKQTEPDTDKLQNHVEQLLRTYISPMPHIYVVAFVTATSERWGAIVIPPRNCKPHMFFKDLQCINPKHTRRRGEWFVRRGATTDLGFPEDLALITQRQTELLLEPLRESIRNLQSRITKVEETYNSALFKLVERTVSGLPGSHDRVSETLEELRDGIGEALGMDLSTRFKQRLRTPEDALAEDFFTDAKILGEFLASSSSVLPWAPQPKNSPENKQIIEGLEERTRPLMLAVATILLNDDGKVFEKALLRVVKILAKQPEVPTGVTFNRIGEGLRYYPLGLIIYTIFICGVAANRGDLLKLVAGMPLKTSMQNTMQNMKFSLTEIFFDWYGAREFFNQALGQRRCEPIAQRIRQVISDRMGDTFAESEPEAFFQGEFVLALSHIDACMTNRQSAEFTVPIPGLYLFAREAHGPINTLLIDRGEWLEELYAHSLIDILNAFDQNARRVADPNCFWLGLPNTASLYQEALQARVPKK